MSIASQINIMKAAVFCPAGKGNWGLPLVFIGEPGPAKTSVVEEFAATWDLPCEVLSPGERGEGAFGVVPVPAEDEDGNMVLAYPAPEWMTRFKAGRGIVFIDEIIDAPPALRPPLQGLLLARRCGGRKLPPGVRPLAAGNPVELSTNGYELSPAIANRMGHIQWQVPTVREHTAYVLRGDDDFGKIAVTGNAAEEEERVKKAWPGARARAAGLETAFLHRRSALKNQCPKPGDPKASGPWPSDRTWEFALRALASSQIHGLTETETQRFVAAFISEGVADEWFTFMTNQDLPDPEKLLDAKDTFTPEKLRLDRTIAVLQSCTALVTLASAAKRNDRAAVLWGMIDKMCDDAMSKDILVPAVDALIGADLHAMKAAASPCAKLQPVLKAAGIVPGRRR